MAKIEGPAVRLQVRLIGSDEAIAAAIDEFAVRFGDGWQRSTLSLRRRGPNDMFLYGTLIIPVRDSHEAPGG